MCRIPIFIKILESVEWFWVFGIHPFHYSGLLSDLI